MTRLPAAAALWPMCSSPTWPRWRSSQGSVWFSAQQYQSGSTAFILLRDGDLSAQTGVTVTVTSAAGDSENLTLNAVGDGYFQGSIALSSGSVKVGDGVLETTPGTNAIRVTYHDANTGNGSAADVSATATVCDPLVITTNTSITGIAVGKSYSLTLQATGGVGADIWMASGTLPPGLWLNSSTGVISGTPTTAGHYQVVVTAYDSGTPQNSASKKLNFGVGAVVVSVAPVGSPKSFLSPGDMVSFAVTFAQVVTVTGTPTIALNAGSGAVATYVSGSGTATLVFRYSVGSGQYSYGLDYTSPGSLTLSGGSISAAPGQAASLTLPAPGSDGLAAANILVGPLPTSGTVMVSRSTLTATFITNPATNLTPAGTVDFYDATTDTDLGEVTLSGGVATVSLTNLAGGSHVFIARYLGNTQFQALQQRAPGKPDLDDLDPHRRRHHGQHPRNGRSIGHANSVATDAAGNIYIADPDQHCVRRVDHATGIITTLAGNGKIGSGGDGGPATAASLALPVCIVFDGNNDSLYITEQPYIRWTGNNPTMTGGFRVRKVDLSTGIITTVAGNGIQGFVCDGKQATATSLQWPSALALDPSGNLLIADSDRICKVDCTTGIITTIAGGIGGGYAGDGGPATAAKFFQPTGLAVDSADNIYIADTFNCRVRKIDHATGVITTIAGTGAWGYSGDGGPATAAALYCPLALCIDSAGNLVIADWVNCRIREVNPTTGVITTIAGTGGFCPWGQSSEYGDGGSATSAILWCPESVALDPAGNILIADTGNFVIRSVNHTTGIISRVAGNVLCNYGGDGGPASAAALNMGSDVVTDAAGNIYIADTNNDLIRRVDHTTGVITTVAGVAAFGQWNGSGQATATPIDCPTSLALDNQGNLYFVEDSPYPQSDHVPWGSEYPIVCKVNLTTGVMTTVAGSLCGYISHNGDGGQATAAALACPTGITVDNFGHLYIADAEDNTIREVDLTTGIIATVAGTGQGGYSGDGGLATAAQLSDPQGVVVDAAGNLYISDSGNNCIREVNYATGIITTIAGNGQAGYSGDGGPATSAELELARQDRLRCRGKPLYSRYR